MSCITGMSKNGAVQFYIGLHPSQNVCVKYVFVVILWHHMLRFFLIQTQLLIDSNFFALPVQYLNFILNQRI